MAATRSTAQINPGTGAALELVGLPGSMTFVPSTVVRGIGAISGDVADVLVDDDGSLRTRDVNTDHAAEMFPQRALQYARDANDAMRVSATGTVATGGVQLWNYGTYALWYGVTGSPNSMDAREQQRESTIQTFQGQRNRWSIT